MKKYIVSENSKNKATEALSSKGHNVTIEWESAIFIAKNNFRVNVVCNHCGDSELRTISNLYSGAYLCRNCKLVKYLSSCKELNLTLIEKINSPKHVFLNVVCNKCNGYSQVESQRITSGVFKCEHCQVLKYKEVCDNLNLNFIGKQHDVKTKLLTECKVCGELKTLDIANALAGRFKCNGCQLIKYKESIAKKNCVLIRTEMTAGVGTFIHYMNSNGDEFKASGSNVLRGWFEVSLDGSWAQPHSTYLIKLQVENDLFIYKIGTANDPERRARSLKLNKNYEVFILDSFEDRFAADKLESELHSEFSNFRLKPEQASAHTDSNVLRKNKTGKYHRVKDGITEWFSSEVYETLKVRYNLA